jgi:hypothetical protein
MKKLLLSVAVSFLVCFALNHSVAMAQPAASAAAPSTPVYAVLSLIGDKLDIIVARQQTGTRVDANLRESVAISNAVFDDAAVSAIAEAVRKIDSKAELAAINTRSAVLFEKQRELFAQSGDKILIPDAIRTAVKNQNATHLFLVTKRRDDALAQFVRGNSDGKGRLEGLGFYLDGSVTTKVLETGDGGRGFIAPFVYIDIALIEVASSKVIKKEKVVATKPVSAGQAAKDVGSPWDALSSAEKVRMVNAIIQDEVARVVPELLK